MGLSAMRSGTSCQLREDNSGEIRYNNVLGTSGKEIFVTVKGGFTVTSSAIENLTVTIDGVPYMPPGQVFGRQSISIEDLATSPPVQPPAPVKGASNKASPTKGSTSKGAPRGR